MDKKKNKYDVDIPKEVLDAFARYIIPEIRRFHESEEGRSRQELCAKLFAGSGRPEVSQQ